MTPPRIRQRLTVQGIVQGVGFRPFVYGLAHHHHLSGFVGNDSQGVFMEVEGRAEDIKAFVEALRHQPPPLAHIETLSIADVPIEMVNAHDAPFVILPSVTQANARTLISPDLCVCDDCLREMNDPQDRRYRYPFINCTHCGPRFTIVRDIPYDRPLTTMADFVMCEACAAEYHDPNNRRFHAQPNACPDCGPQVMFVQGDTRIVGEQAIQRTAALLAQGGIVAIKGIGGFHLACDATNAHAIDQLRQRKRRPHKPFAVMVRDVPMAQSIAHLNAAEIALLTRRERPVVLVQHKAAALPDAIAPGLHTAGLMLPYTPLHVLLVDRPLVMTSANLSGEPIISDDDEAQHKLSTLADAFLLHNRAIHVPCDDAVMRVFAGADYPVRRSRGYAPFPVTLPFDAPPLLAVGGELKSTFCLTHGRHAFMSQHIGDMANLETLHAFQRAYEHMRAIFRIDPQAIVCDRHPRYLSSQWARQQADALNLPLITVQHHQAHVAAVMAENELSGPVIGISYDGTGYGDDGAIWGGEVFIAHTIAHMQRVWHLPYLPLPGGDAAVKHPYRMALAALWSAGIAWQDDLPPVQAASEQERRILRQQLERNLNVVPTSSMGRLFDVVAALIGVRQSITYEAQAAIELETYSNAAQAAIELETYSNAGQAAIELETHANTIDAPSNNAPYALDDISTLLNAIVRDYRAGESLAWMAYRFHNRLVAHMVALCERIRQQHGIGQVVLSGGVFQNMTLLQGAVTQLQAHHFAVFIQRRVPTNDGGLALGQAVMAAHTLL